MKGLTPSVVDSPEAFWGKYRLRQHFIRQYCWHTGQIPSIWVYLDQDTVYGEGALVRPSGSPVVRRRPSGNQAESSVREDRAVGTVRAVNVDPPRECANRPSLLIQQVLPHIGGQH